MSLLPLEFSDCLLDSPYFRENLKAHEKQLDQTSLDIKGIAKDINEVLEAAKVLSKTKRTLANSLSAFQFDCLGTSLTDDEIIIANSLKEFSKFLGQVEDEMDRMLENGFEKFIVPLEAFRKEQIGSVKKVKKEFEKQTSRFCATQDRYVGINSKKEDSLAEAAELLRFERKNLNASSLEYVYLMHVVQEKKKVEFVEAIVNFMQAWATYYRHGQAVTSDFSIYMNDLKSRVQKTRGNYSATIEQYDNLKQKMKTGHQDPGIINKMYTRQGYLYAQNKKNIKIGSTWTKYFCQYQAKQNTFTMIPYNQLGGKISSSTETIRVTECVCKEETMSEKFRFIISGEDLSDSGSFVTHTFQAMSDYERKQWVQAMGGTWPAVSTLQRLKADSVEDNLNSNAFTFLKDCLNELELRGLGDQGLYRVGGVLSKVKKLLNSGLDPAKGDGPIDLSDPKQWESKTIASAVKQYFRDLSQPLMTHHLYQSFVEAVKHDSEEQRIDEIRQAVRQMPNAAKEMLKVLIRHLNKVACHSEVNLMTASNLGVCFGPTLLRPKEETVASIMDIKFCNEVVEILIENCFQFFPEDANSSPEIVHQHRKLSSSETNSALSQEINTNCEGGGGGGGMDTPDRAKRGSSTPLRARSLSSFSQLSTNSLPDIKEFKETSGSSSSSSKSKVEMEAKEISSEPYKEVTSSSSLSFVSKQSSLPSAASRRLSNDKSMPLMKSSSTQDDLMASLEMMNSLAADLPTSTTSLKRSLTLQPLALRQANNANIRLNSETSKKPPLPKLSLNNGNGDPGYKPYHHAQSHGLLQRQNSSPSPSILSSTSADSHSSSPRQANAAKSPSDFLSRLQERLQQQQKQNQSNSDASHPDPQASATPMAISQETAPVVPTRKYRRVIVSPTSFQFQPHPKHSSSNEPKHLAPTSPNTAATKTSTVGLRIEEEGDDKLIRRLQPDSNGANDDGTSSISSSAVSINSNQDQQSGSKYENVTIAHPGGLHASSTKGEDGDDEGSEVSSILSDQLSLEAANAAEAVFGGAGHHPDLVPTTRFMRPAAEIPYKKRVNKTYRDSGPYENVIYNEQDEEIDEQINGGDGGKTLYGKKSSRKNYWEHQQEEENKYESLSDDEKVGMSY